MTPGEWIAAYGRAWEEGDVDAAVSLFTEDAVYRSHPFRPPHVGHDAIRAYWTGATSEQEAVSVAFGEPMAAGRRAAVEWWTRMRQEGEDVTLPGCLVLRFAADGRCEELREYWHVEPGLAEPPPGWGA
jgi:ketosteroid isomerase-like protein